LRSDADVLRDRELVQSGYRMTFWLGVLVGLWIGVAIGFVTAGVLSITKRKYPEEEDEVSKRRRGRGFEHPDPSC
jgi:hypothetical protein